MRDSCDAIHLLPQTLQKKSLCSYTGRSQHSKYLSGDAAVTGCWCHPSFLLANTKNLIQQSDQEVISSHRDFYYGAAYKATHKATDCVVDLAGRAWGGISVICQINVHTNIKTVLAWQQWSFVWQTQSITWQMRPNWAYEAEKSLAWERVVCWLGGCHPGKWHHKNFKETCLQLYKQLVILSKSISTHQLFYWWTFYIITSLCLFTNKLHS